MARSILGIGRLLELEVLQNGRVRKMRLKGRWLAWEPGKRCFHVCRPKGRASGSLDSSVSKAHRRFHQAAARGAMCADVPEMSGELRDLGLVKALVYDVPASVRSPGKNPYQWHHAFGDTGHKGGDSYPEKVMPALKRDKRGNLFIVRRPGNIFRVDTWLRG